MEKYRLPQGVAVVTGAGGGMGSASVRQLASEGWQELLICDLDAERLEQVTAPLRKAKITVDILAGDIADPIFPDRLVSALAGRPVSALIHTAGLSPAMGSPERILDVNLDATARLVGAIRDHMAKDSAAVLFASNSSYIPMPATATEAFLKPLPASGAVSLANLTPDSATAYVLSKLGVRALVKREAKSFGARGARIVSLSPGAIETRMTKGDAAKMALRMARESASGRMGQAEEVAAVAAFLCSPAASLVTAVDWLVDGGHTAALGY